MLRIKFRDVGNTEFLFHHQKYIAPLVGAAAISAGSSLLGSLTGGLFAKKGSDAAAKAALQATRETNAANLKLAQYQNDWNVAQWNRQNAYNTPLAQRQRYEEAGINPYLALGNINSGSAQSLMSADMSNQQSGADAYNMQAQGAQQLGSAISSGVSNATSQFFNAQYQQEQTKALQIQNTENLLSMNKRVQGLEYDNQAKKMANELYNANMQSLMNITKNQERESYARVAQANLQTVGSQYDVATKAFTNKFILPAQRDIAQMTIGKMVSEIAYQKAQQHWTEKQTALASKYAAAAMLSANANWLSSKAAWSNSLTNASSVASQNWYRTQQNFRENMSNYRESTRFGIESKYLERSIKIGVEQLESQGAFQFAREKQWLHSGGFNKFMWSAGESLSHLTPFKFFGK